MLRQTRTGWEFENEALLEDCLQQHLRSLLGLTVIAQQYGINGQVCDLVARSETGQLAILELKNQEDRYVVQQLTRYFDAFLAERPFAEQVDYGQPIRLLAIAPTFHRDNFTDRKYSRVSIEFLTFQLQPDQGGVSLTLSHLDTGGRTATHVPEQIAPSQPAVASPPKALLSLLRPCPTEDQQGVLALRQQLLSFNQRMREITSASSVLYGNGKSNPCAEVRYDSKRERVALFLWLPHAVIASPRRNIVARMRVWTDWQVVSDLAHIPQALGRTVTVDEWLEGRIRPLNKVLPKGQWLKQRYDDDEVWRLKFINAHRSSTRLAHYRSGVALTFTSYQQVVQRPELLNSLIDIAQLALKTWLGRQ
jgi:RecB family endonuclease NucS